MIIYIDLIFLENLFMNMIIIYATSIIVRKELKITRIILGSIVGALYACIYYISNLEIFSNIVLKTILSLVIVYISFNSVTIKDFLKLLLIFYLTSFTFGGVTFSLLYYFNSKKILFQNGVLVGLYPLKMILIGGLLGFVIIICSFKSIKNRIAKKDMICKLKIKFGKNEVVLNAMIDTGNFLKDPITRDPVVIVEKTCLLNVIPLNILNNVNSIINRNVNIGEGFIPKIRLIPFTALGADNGLILGIKPDEFYINYQAKIINNNNVIIGICDKKISKTNKYKALIGLDLIEKTN